MSGLTKIRIFAACSALVITLIILLILFYPKISMYKAEREYEVRKLQIQSEHESNLSAISKRVESIYSAMSDEQAYHSAAVESIENEYSTAMTSSAVESAYNEYLRNKYGEESR